MSNNAIFWNKINAIKSTPDLYAHVYDVWIDADGVMVNERAKLQECIKSAATSNHLLGIPTEIYQWVMELDTRIRERLEHQRQQYKAMGGVFRRGSFA